MGATKAIAVLALGLVAGGAVEGHGQQAASDAGETARALHQAAPDRGRAPLQVTGRVPTTWRWGPQRPDLIRYNRIEALSIGARGQVRPRTALGTVTVQGTARFGVGDLVPNIRLDVVRETLRRRVTLSAYHELAATDEQGGYFGIGNSAMALLFGRDDGDYYRRSGATLRWTPLGAERLPLDARAYAEYQRPVSVETEFALFRSWSSFAFRPNLVTAEGWEYGAEVRLTPRWGGDPAFAQGGLDLLVQAGAGETEYVRSSLVARANVPLPGQLRVEIEAGGGTSWGSPSPQRLWYLGGPRTLRGYDPRVAGGESFLRGRAALARMLPFGAVAAFSDFGWAGPRDRLDVDDALYSMGVGVSVLDGLLNLDGAYALREPEGFRLDFYLDGVL